MSMPETRQALQEELKTTIANIMDIDEAQIQGETRFVEDLGMESLMALEIMVALEKKYGIKLGEDELTKLSCLNSVADLLEEKRAAVAQ